MPANVTIRIGVPVGYTPGDVARLCGDGGSGTVDYDNPLPGHAMPLFPDGTGVYGCGYAPCGAAPCGGHWLVGTWPGCGRAPCGVDPCGTGGPILTAHTRVTACGTYKFGFRIEDQAGNANAGSPGEVAVAVHTAPLRPTRLTKNSYDPLTETLTLAVAT